MARKIHHDLHIPFAKLGELSPAKLRAIDGPKFITHKCVNSKTNLVGQETLAVLISRNQWKIFNHRVPDVDFDKPMLFCVNGQTFLTIPCETSIGGVLVAKESTGLDIITRRKPRKKASK